MPDTERSWTAPLVEFGVHVTVGTGIFILIAIPAIGINLGIKLLPPTVDPYMVQGLVAAEYLIFAVDLGLFAIHTLRSAINAGTAIWSRR